MLGGAPKGEVNEERLIMDVDGAELPFPDNSVDVGTILLIQFRNFLNLRYLSGFDSRIEVSNLNPFGLFEKFVKRRISIDIGSGLDFFKILKRISPWGVGRLIRGFRALIFVLL